MQDSAEICTLKNSHARCSTSKYAPSERQNSTTSLRNSKRLVMVCVRHALYPLGPVATLRFCHLRPRCVSKQRRTTNVIITDRVWWIWCDAGLAAVATRPQRSPHSVASNSRPDYFAATRSRSLFLTLK